jgi:hypothetical protein
VKKPMWCLSVRVSNISWSKYRCHIWSFAATMAVFSHKRIWRGPEIVARAGRGNSYPVCLHREKWFFVVELKHCGYASFFETLPFLIGKKFAKNTVCYRYGGTERSHNAVERRFSDPIRIDELVKTSTLLATVIPALDNNTQGQAAAGIQ